MDENRKTWNSPRQAKRGRILVLEQKRPRATEQGTGSVAPILYPSNLGWIITSQNPEHLSGAVVSHQDSRGAVAMGTNGSRHWQTSCLQIIYPSALPWHSWGAGDNSPGKAALGKGQCWAEAEGSPLRDGVMGIGDTINGTSHQCSPGWGKWAWGRSLLKCTWKGKS